MVKKHKRSGQGKDWKDLSLSQKRHRIFAATTISPLRFWYICGKDRQLFYQQIPMDDTTIDKIRDDMFSEYMSKLSTSNTLDKERKEKLITSLLYKKGE